MCEFNPLKHTFFLTNVLHKFFENFVHRGSLITNTQLEFKNFQNPPKRFSRKFVILVFKIKFK